MYTVTKDKAVIEDIEVVVYGIRYDDECSVSDISTDKSAVEKLADDFNRYGLDPIHLYDAIEDFLGQ